MKKTLARYTLLPLFLVLIIDTMGVGLLFPVLGPLLMDPHGILPVATSQTVRSYFYGAVIALYFIGLLLGSPFLGDLSDRIGRKKALLISLFSKAASFLLSAYAIYAADIKLLMLGRFLDGATAGSQPIAQASIIDMSNPKKKARNLGFISLAMCVGWAAGPVAGGYLSSSHILSWFNYSTPFITASLFALMNGIILIFSYTETFFPKEKKPVEILKGIKIFLAGVKDPRLRILNLVLILEEYGWGIYFQFVPFYFVRAYHASTDHIGLFTGYMSLIFALSMMLLMPLSARYLSYVETAILTLISMGTGLFIVAHSQSESTQWWYLPLIALGGGLGYTILLALFSEAVDEFSQGWVMGVASSMGGVAFLLGGVTIGLLSTAYITLPFWAGGVASLMGALLMYCKRGKIKM